MELFLKCEVYLISITILVFIALMQYRHDRSLRAKLLTSNIAAMVLMFTADLIGVIAEATTGCSPWVVRIMNGIYFSAFGAVGWLWYLFSFVSVGGQLTKKRTILSAFPAFVLMILGTASCVTGWLFTVSAENMYARGPLYFMQPLICYGYCVIALARNFSALRKADTYEKKDTATILLTYVLLPAIGGAAEILLPGRPFLPPCTAIASIWVYVNGTQQLITRDPGTGMNNRYQLFRYLDGQIIRRKRGETKTGLWVLMLDIDNFKIINDSFGHMEGDHALELIGNALKSVCGRHNCFGARFGGDEFVLVLETDNPAAAMRLEWDVQESLAATRPEEGYAIGASTGLTEWTAEHANATELMRSVDAMLYARKRHRI
ncbi:MAG: diguanylate cyclase [Clostridia bacterium]|nr:diguanylate cyclase [Clostridia bacterium]